MQPHKIIALLTISALLGHPGAIRAGTFYRLGYLPGGNLDSFARDVSDDGLVVVGESRSAETPGQLQAFRWTVEGGMQALGILPGATWSNAYATNGDGQLVVGQSKGLGVTWTAFTGMAPLSSPGTARQLIEASSADGHVLAGHVVDEGELSGEAARWENTQLIRMGFLPGGTSSGVHGMSADGSVLVGTGSSSSGGQAFRWTAAEGMVGLGDVTPGGTNSSASGISGDGKVIVGAASGGSHAYRWTLEDEFELLGELPGTSQSIANAASYDGSIIVGTSDSLGFIWDRENGMRLIDDVLASVGADPGEMNQLNPWAISADGRMIVGLGHTPAGREAWAAYIPEPSTLLLAVPALPICVAFTRRRQAR